ncbi:MAG TPA: adenylate/guanylate cyclase domain-containing protein [Ktedonosporobacter sp.]|jgi:class 3 adenylate cyclase|nr:adenylate/guanylate cyclase domain-containing protein [Ktedonosporobacter sp.]
MAFKADLEEEVKKILQTSWKITGRKVIPNPKDLSLENDAAELKAAVLYADMADSTVLVDRHERSFAAEIYKAYLRLAARIINDEKGKRSITAYDGDRVMAVFLGDTKETVAVRCALKINFAVHEIINPLLKKQYPNKKYKLKHVVGIDTSDLLVARIGVKSVTDLVWVGRAANHAAKLCSRNGEHSIYITRAVFRAMDDIVKFEGKKLMWNKENWTERGNRIIYGSSRYLPIK